MGTSWSSGACLRAVHVAPDVCVSKKHIASRSREHELCSPTATFTKDVPKLSANSPSSRGRGGGGGRPSGEDDLLLGTREVLRDRFELPPIRLELLLGLWLLHQQQSQSLLH